MCYPPPLTFTGKVQYWFKRLKMWTVYTSADPSITSLVLGHELTLPSASCVMQHTQSVIGVALGAYIWLRYRGKTSLISPAPQDKDWELKFHSYASVVPETKIKHISELVQLVNWENTTGYISSCNILYYKHSLSLPPSHKIKWVLESVLPKMKLSCKVLEY